MKIVKVVIVGMMINIITLVHAQEKNIQKCIDNIDESSLPAEEDTVSFQSSIRKVVLAMNTENKFTIPDNKSSKINEKFKPGIYYLNVFPNPLNKTIQVSFKTVANINLIIHVVDKKGKVIYAQSYFDHCGDFFNLIELSKEVNGIYYIRLFTNETSIQRKLIMSF